MTLSENRSSLFFLCITLSFVSTHGARFLITNNCSFTVWAAAMPGGGRELNARGGTWTLNVSSDANNGRIWPRTGCNFDESGRGKCQTGDCGGLLQCQTGGEPPVILAEYSLNQSNNLDFYDISLVDGFNVPMEFSLTSNGCTRGLKCTGDINGECPDVLKAPGGCYNPCTVFKTDQYCCQSGQSCGSDKIQNLQFVQVFDGLGVLCSTNYTIFFKNRCPDAYSYSRDDILSSTLTCPAGTDYKIVFCP